MSLAAVAVPVSLALGSWWLWRKLSGRAPAPVAESLKTGKLYALLCTLDHVPLAAILRTSDSSPGVVQGKIAIAQATVGSAVKAMGFTPVDNPTLRSIGTLTPAQVDAIAKGSDPGGVLQVAPSSVWVVTAQWGGAEGARMPPPLSPLSQVNATLLPTTDVSVTGSWELVKNGAPADARIAMAAAGKQWPQDAIGLALLAPIRNTKTKEQRFVAVVVTGVDSRGEGTVNGIVTYKNVKPQFEKAVWGPDEGWPVALGPRDTLPVLESLESPPDADTSTMPASPDDFANSDI